MKRAAQALVDRMTALEAFLVHTDHLTTAGVPTREQRAALIGPQLDALLALGVRPRRLGHYLARRATPPRRMKTTTTTKEPIMPNDKYESYKPGGVVDEPPEETARRAEADAARRTAAAARTRSPRIAGVVTMQMSLRGQRYEKPEAVREHRSRELVRAILAGAERDHVPLLTWLVDRQTRRGSR